MDANCPFCNINEEVSRIVHQDELVIGMLSNPRLVPGHLLIMPRKHHTRPWFMDPEEKRALYDKVLTYQQIIVNTIAPGCDIRQNYRPFIPQGRLKVDHVHFHVLPRWEKEQDELYQKVMVHEAPLFSDLEWDERQKYTKLYNLGFMPPESKV